MKRQAISLVSLLSLLLVAGSAIAQTVHVSADIPFNFVVGSKTYPAGAYSVKTMGDRVNGNPAGRTTTFRWILVRWVRLTNVGGSRPCQKIRLNGTQELALSHSF